MDQNDQRDLLEELTNKALGLEEQFNETYTVEYLKLDETTEAIRLGDEEAEVEFCFDPRLAPRFAYRIMVEYDKWAAKHGVQTEVVHHNV